MSKSFQLCALLTIVVFSLHCAKTNSDSANHATASSTATNSLELSTTSALDKFAQEGCSFQGPPIKGSTNQGGYAFEYESYSGTGPTGACRMYRLRNAPGRLYTPVRWKDSGEIWFDTALPGCPAGTVCPVLDVVKQSIRVQDGRSSLSYGVNKNEYSEDPSAFKRHQGESLAGLSGELPRFVTTVSGVIADAEQRPLPISIRVASYARGAKGPFDFGYEFETGPFASDFSIDLMQKNPRTSFNVTWSATSSEEFLTAAKERELMWVAGPDREVKVSFSYPSLILSDKELLIVRQGTTPIFVTSAPAYVAKEPR